MVVAKKTSVDEIKQTPRARTLIYHYKPNHRHPQPCSLFPHAFKSWELAVRWQEHEVR